MHRYMPVIYCLTRRRPRRFSLTVAARPPVLFAWLQLHYYIGGFQGYFLFFYIICIISRITRYHWRRHRGCSNIYGLAARIAFSYTSCTRIRNVSHKRCNAFGGDGLKVKPALLFYKFSYGYLVFQLLFSQYITAASSNVCRVVPKNFSATTSQ